MRCMLEYWPRNMIEPHLGPQGGLLRIGSEQGLNDIVIPDSPLDAQHFVLGNAGTVVGDRTRLQVTARDLPGGSRTWVDGVCLDGAGDQALVALDKPVFLSDDATNPRFLLGFDPVNYDLWRVPSDRRGLEVRLDKVTRIHPKGTGISDVTATLRPNEFVGLYGGSGAGKTTLVEVILGLASLNEGCDNGGETGGAVFTDSREANGPHGVKREALGDRVAYLPQEVWFPEHLTCDELLRLAAHDRGFSRSETEAMLQPSAKRFDPLERCGLDQSVHQRHIRHLSGGERRRLALAVTLLRDDLGFLIVDEPTAGLDPESESTVLNTLRRISRQGVTVLMITHAVAALPHFDRVLVLRKPDGQPSSLSFCGAWDAWAFADKEALAPASDAERLAFLVSTKSAGRYPRPIIPPERPWFGAIGPAQESSPKRRSRDGRGTSWSWFGACLTAIWRDGRPHQQPSKDRVTVVPMFRLGRGLVSLAGLGVLSVAALQTGVPPERSWLLLVLFSVAAPWLAATYSAVFAEAFLPFYAFECLAGIRARWFVKGLWLASGLPALVVSLVFAVGTFCALDFKGPARALVWLESRCWWHRGPTIAAQPQMAGSQQAATDASGCSIGPLCPLSLVRRFCPAYPDQACRKSHKHSESWWQEWLNWPMRRVEDSDMTNLYPADWYRYAEPDASGALREAVPGFLRVWLVLFGLCMAGSALGVACLAQSLKARGALISVVALFIVFLSLSRATVACDREQSFHAPIWRMRSILAPPQSPARSGAEGLLEADSRRIVPLLLSCLSLPRYGFNLLVYQPEAMTQERGCGKSKRPSLALVLATEAGAGAFLFVVLPLVFACRRLSQRPRVLALVTRGDAR